jgi:hypothetical protein
MELTKKSNKDLYLEDMESQKKLIQDLNSEYVFRQKYIKEYTTIPIKFINKFTDILNELELETNCIYQLTILENLCSNPIIVSEFNKRTNLNYIVEMTETYKELNGIYKSIEDIENKISEFKNGTLSIIENKKSTNEYNKYLWVCPKCNFYENNYLSNKLCQKCRYRHTSIWEYVSINKNGEISKTDGGSVSIVHPLGFIKIIKNNT